MKTKKMTFTIIISVILLSLGFWVVCFETPKWLLVHMMHSIGENAKYSKRGSERQKINKQTAKINIEWTDNLDGNFSFKDKWQYEESTVFDILKSEGYDLNELVKGMSTGAFVNKMFTDNDIEAFCKKWETKEEELGNSNVTHYPYTLKTNGECEQLDYILAEQISREVVECESSGKTMIDGEKAASLNLNIVGNVCYPVLGFTKYNIYQFLQAKHLVKQSHIPSPFEDIYPCKEGSITIDKTCWDGGWLKASFSFVFVSPDSGDFVLSGKIFTPIGYKDLKGEPLVEFDDGKYRYALSLIGKYK